MRSAGGSGICSMRAASLAVVAALGGRAGQRALVLCGESPMTVDQHDHQSAITSRQLRGIARQAWSLMAEVPGVEIGWVPRGGNPAGQRMGR